MPQKEQKIAAAVYLYQADNDGEWGKLRFDFENGTAEGNVMIVNESINNYPQQVEFIRNDTGEQIYQSKAIPVGSKIERAALDVELPAGTYECTAMFHNLDPVSGEIIGTAGAIINITIKN